MLITTLVFNHSYRYDAERLIRNFVLPQNFKILENIALPDMPADKYIFSEIKDGGTELQFKVAVKSGNTRIERVESAPFYETDESERKRIICALLYDVLLEYTGAAPDWGLLTGVKPLKFIAERLKEFKTRKSAGDWFTGKFRVKPEKLSLAFEVIENQRGIAENIPDKSFHLYVGIPFCPSRCKYCSFVSESLDRARTLIPRYAELLVQELETLGGIASRYGLKPDTVYIGGGTPTSLPVEEQALIYETIARRFDLSAVREYTIEAGRPETINDDILFAVKRAGGNRVSINPQTMNDLLLRKIGRGHAAYEITRAYNNARAMGFDWINMDLISGLPGDNSEIFTESLERVLEMKPENITIHSFAVKKGAEWREAVTTPKNETRISEKARELLKQNGYEPYYLYRLSNTESGGENVGYSLGKKFYGLYNIYITDEKSTVLAAGCSGATRLAGKTGMKKHYNFKYPFEYINRFNEITAKREIIEEFFEKEL